MMEDVLTSILSFKVGGDATFDAFNYIQYFDKLSKCFEKCADPELKKFSVNHMCDLHGYKVAYILKSIIYVPIEI
jgi:hypothetical protein